MTPTYATKPFDTRRTRLLKRVNILVATTNVEKRDIADRAGVDRSYLTHLLSGKRNRALETYIDSIEEAVSHFEKNPK